MTETTRNNRVQQKTNLRKNKNKNFSQIPMSRKKFHRRKPWQLWHTRKLTNEEAGFLKSTNHIHICYDVTKFSNWPWKKPWALISCLFLFEVFVLFIIFYLRVFRISIFQQSFPIESSFLFDFYTWKISSRLFSTFLSNFSINFSCKMAGAPSKDEVVEEVKGILAKVVDDVGKASTARQLVIGGATGWWVQKFNSFLLFVKICEMLDIDQRYLSYIFGIYFPQVNWLHVDQSWKSCCSSHR